MNSPAAPQIATLQDQAGGMRWWVVVSLLGIGILAWLSVGRAIIDWPDQIHPLAAGAFVLILMAIPRVRRFGVEALEGLEKLLENRIGRAALIIAILSALYFAFTAWRQGRYLHPHWHDELSYVIQMRMLAEGKLWMPPHPLTEHFDTFYVITDRAYASMYFPGTALLYVPQLWLNLPPVILPICAAGAAVGLTFWILATLIDPLSAIVGAMLMISTPILRTASIMLMSNVPVLLFGLLLICSWINWNRSHRLRWALAMGIFAGWAAITRPLEAISFALPIGLAILFRMRELKWPSRLAAASLIIIGATPFLTLQLIVNSAITGHWTESPWQYYCKRDFPQAALGFSKFDPSIRPRSTLPQKQQHYQNFMPENAPHRTPHLMLLRWTGWRGQTLAASTLPYTILLILLPLGIPACGRRWRWVVAAALPVFILLYSLSIFFQEYYSIVMIPAMLLLVLLGANVLSNSMSRFAPILRTALLLWMALLAISALPEARPRHKDQFFEPTLMRRIDNWERNYHGNRAIVLHRYSPTRNLNEEPVFNTTTPWPDDAWIIRAHDLGDNQKLFDYYAKLQPDREVFHFDESTNIIRRLGTAAELSKR